MADRPATVPSVAVAPVQPLQTPAITRASLLVVADLLEDRLVGHVVYVVLVRRPTGPVARRRVHLDNLQAVRRELRFDDVVNASSGVTRAANLHVHVPWPNEHRRGSHAVSARSRRLGNGHENVSISEWLGLRLNSTIGWHINRPRFCRERRLPPIQLQTLAAVNHQ